MEPITVTATQVARGLSEILNQVYYQGKEFEIKKGKQVMAVLSLPKTPKKTQKSRNIRNLEDLDAFFKRLPKLDEEDMNAFEQAINEMRSLPTRTTEITWD